MILSESQYPLRSNRTANSFTAGPTVRVAPNELSFINAQAWDDIYGFRVRSSLIHEVDFD